MAGRPAPAPPAPRSVSTAPFHGSQVVFSPFSPARLALAGSQNYGIAGSGVLTVYEEGPAGFGQAARLDWPHPLTDVTWSEVNEAVLVVAGGDGSVIIHNFSSQTPPAVLQGHTADVSSVQWSVTRLDRLVLSASWDGSVRIWDPEALSCVAVLSGHEGLVYQACWSPLRPRILASVGGDGNLRISDGALPSHTATCVHAHTGEVLACDWSKYDQHQLFTAGVDALIKVWDSRRLTAPVLTLAGHSRAIKRLKCSPFHASIVASCSYDFTVRLWDVTRPQGPVETVSHHSEFVTGLDASCHQPHQLADCSWDCTMKIYSPLSLLSLPS